MEVLGRERRRRWSIEEKRGIVAEASQPGVSASWVARRYGIAPSQLFAWRKQFREEAEASFLPVVVEEDERQTVTEGRIEVTLAQGRRLSAPSNIEPEQLGRLLRVVVRA
ncbi:MAG: transposase [Kiloniellales bacterium]